MPNNFAGPNTYTGTNVFSDSMVLPPTVTGEDGTLPISLQAQRVLSLFLLPLQDARVHDAPQTPLPTTPATDDLGLVIGTFGTNGVLIQTGDLKAAGATTRYCRWPQIIVPHNYDAAETAMIRLFAGMETTIADVTATIDVECYVTDGVGGVSADKCTTAAQSINSLTDANYDFQLGATLVAGDILDIRVAIAINDAATGTAVTGNLGRAYLGVDVR